VSLTKASSLYKGTSHKDVVCNMNNALNKRVGQYWTNRQKLDTSGLTLLDECIRNLTDNQNWDPLSRFISRASALNGNDRTRVMGVIRAALGDQVSYKKDANHPSGGKMSTRNGLAWADVTLLNSYGVVQQAIEQKKGFRDSDMHKAIKGQQPAPALKDADVEKSAKHIVKYLSGLKGVKPGLILHEVEKMMKAAAVASAPVVLDEKGEPNH
jgi:hypothetical protein